MSTSCPQRLAQRFVRGAGSIDFNKKFNIVPVVYDPTAPR